MLSIEVKNLEKSFPESKGLFKNLQNISNPNMVTVLHDINLEIKKGEIFGILGQNGAGKTTLLKIFASLILPSSGIVRINNYNIFTNSLEIRKSTGYIDSNERSFYWRITGRQNLNFFARLKNLDKEESKKQISTLIELLDLTKKIDDKFSTFSRGIKQRMAIARGLLGNPDLLIIDEPTTGLDLKSSSSLHNFLKNNFMKKSEKTIVLASHNMEEVQKLCDRVMILHEGLNVACGEIKEVYDKLNTDNNLELKQYSYNSFYRKK